MKINIKKIVAATGLEEYQVRYRLEKLGIKGEQIHPRCFVYPEKSIEAVKNWRPHQKSG